MQYSEVANLWLNTLSNTVSGGLFTIKSDSKFTLPYPKNILAQPEIMGYNDQ